MCPVKGCPWRGENQLLQTHYNYECRLKQYLRSQQIAVVEEEGEEGDEEVEEKVNEHVQKGNLVSRVISKNPGLMSFRKVEVEVDAPEGKMVEYEKEQKYMVSRATQTEVRVSSRGRKEREKKYGRRK